MADYKGQTRTPYMNALEAARKAAEQQAAATAGVSVTEQEIAEEGQKKRGRPAKAKE